MPFRLGYRRPLDGTRAVAVMMVLGLHAGLPLMHGGAVGVDIFFVLSGFLITALLLEEWQLTSTISHQVCLAQCCLTTSYACGGIVNVPHRTVRTPC